MSDNTPKTGWFGENARPFSIWALAGSSSIMILKLAFTLTGWEAVGLAAVVLSGASFIYVGKSFENKWTGEANARVEVERAKAVSPPADALKPAEATTDTGELPPDQRVKL